MLKTQELLFKIAINRKKSQKIDEIDCDFFPNEKIDLNGSINVVDDFK